MLFRLYATRLTFRTRAPLSFPRDAAGNRLRGAFGASLHRLGCAEMFEPSAVPGPGAAPSGLRDRPRPFVFRARHLNGVAFPPGETFHFDFHWFDLRRASLDTVMRAFAALFPETELVDAGGTAAPLELCLDPARDPAAGPGAARVQRLTVRFETPTELKAGGETAARPEFGILAARVRDRISTLRALYDQGPLPLDFREFGERAAQVQMTRCETHHVEVSRRSGRTGQRHSLGGFVGEADYQGELAEFVPYLRAAQWTGVGRQTAWGKGELTLHIGTPQN